MMLSPSSHQDSDTSIRLTDTDAAVARLSAAQKQYVNDPFIKYFVPRAHLQPLRPPLINVGTFVRSAAIDDLVEQWLSLSKAVGKRCQIVSLGAGSDTRFWRIATGPHRDAIATYVEIDFPEVTGKKAMIIRKNEELNGLLGSPVDVHISNGGTALHSTIYHLLPADLRLPPSTTLSPLLASEHGEAGPILSPSLPTLLLFECVLVYMSSDSSSAMLRWFVDYFLSSTEGEGALGSIVYEMFGLEDAFGRIMVNNLQARNVALPGAKPYPNLGSLPSRFLSTGFSISHALNLREIRRAYIESVELTRVSKLEMLDEVEELDLVLEHYAISWGLLCSSSSADSWGTWALKKKEPKHGG